MTLRERVGVWVVLAGWSLAAAAADGKTPLVVEDIYRLEAPRSAMLLPGGEGLVYVRGWIDPESKRDRSALWRVEGSADKRRAMEADEPDARAPVLSPDGKWVAFVSTRPRPAGSKQPPAVPPQSDPAADIWLIPATGGKAVPLGGPGQPHGRVFHDNFYGRLAFSPDGTKLAFIADDGADPRTAEEIANDVEVVRPDQGEGYTGYGPAQVWVAHLEAQPDTCAAKRIERLTKGDIWYGDPQWTPDGKRLIVVANKTDDRESVRFSINKNFDLWSIDVASGNQKQLTTGAGPDISPRVSPDGKSVAYMTIPRKGTHRDVFNLAILTLGEGGATTRTMFDHHGPGAEKFPHPPPAIPLPDDGWAGNGHFYFRGETTTENPVIKVDVASGEAVAQSGEDAFVARPRARQRLVPGANEFLRERLIGASKVMSWKSEGRTVEGVLTLPPAEVAKAPYKLLVHPHGGPHSRTQQGFDPVVQMFAANGYAVFQPNFRGSTGYGQAFVDADRGDFGGGDMRDILSGVDQLVRDGVADKDRQFVYGISYGGFMTSWLVGQTNQFRAAVAQNAVTDLIMMWGLSDIQSWTNWEFGGRPWEVPAAYREHSPLAHVGNVKTPTLILHSRDDRRCPLPMGRAFHASLLSRGVPTGLVIYPDEGHGIRQPRHRVDVLRRVLAWFEQHDKK